MKHALLSLPDALQNCGLALGAKTQLCAAPCSRRFRDTTSLSPQGNQMCCADKLIVESLAQLRFPSMPVLPNGV